ncbi:MAG: hypothetical protein UU48_C0009G0040 [Candidatus Uhrbacteria bacterium GW2011_GWF2_41_16]|uniref:Uncharacterized protein n=2 Tax=Candidatus Uhriibacteriota TaxID=1752732 RepID=A0A0G0V9S6_9BACT|nr:MAG: hypothetical protein UU35_C0011G0038 [Candidatus Uhrbacteria bacterium GW2011_GWC2_41_11]KKR97768.1 MAG: hypothetical protein UU48_C0009G0040 [Candidatus Uhrbacteria bacterium GW2011_GWF2_41_16]
MRVRVPLYPPMPNAFFCFFMAKPQFGYKQAENTSSFGLVEKGVEGQSFETRPLVPLEKPQEIVFEKIVRDFLVFALKDRQGVLRLEEARFQNRLVRAIYQRVISDPSDFFSKLRQRVGAKKPGESYVKDRHGHIEMSRYIEDIEIGTLSVVKAVRWLKKRFESQLKIADLEQMIGMNDMLDAGRKIDLVEIQYKGRGKALDVELVRFIQIKGGRHPLTLEEREKIIRAHQTYLNDLIERDVYRRFSARQTKEFFLKESKFGQTWDQLNGDNRKQFDFLVETFQDFFLELATEQELTQENFESIVLSKLSKSVVLPYKLFFQKPESIEFVRFLLDLISEEKEQSSKIVKVVGNWARDLSKEEKEELARVMHRSENTFELTHFSSVIMEVGNDIFIETPLEVNGNPRVLTQKEK